ncbi:MAG: sigma-54-dependent Fis family transcriptional regulator [Bdellovibrionaceae bacterium]|nr:sigma-54-dependent Fis family transcriptional regulator [Pseudobdellovibrionaceae bacterium]
MSSTFNPVLLVIDDDHLIHDSLSLLLPDHWDILSANSLAQAPQDGVIHAIFVDMHLTPNSKVAEGPGIIAAMRERFPLAEIYGMSGDLTIELMEKALAAGARKFLAKPLHPDEVTASFEKIEALWALRSSESRHRSTQTHQWIGQSKAAEKIRFEIANLAGETSPILIEGETGTGKEVIAQILNQQDNRPLIAVNLGAIPENLFESEFFGHVRGAFTGADQMKVGLAEAANGGDLFLDEIEALPLAQQAKLLRFLESGEVRKVGAKDTVHVKVRVIAASNQSLQQMVKEQKFREDLLFRLTSHRLQLPPLRERTDDIEILAKHFLKMPRSAGLKMLAPEAITRLKAHGWPGNVRELKRVIEHLSQTAPLPIIRAEDVDRLLGGASAPAGLGDFPLEQGLTSLVESFEKQVLLKALDRTGKDVDQAAELLQISRSNFYKKMKDYGI